MKKIKITKIKQKGLTIIDQSTQIFSHSEMKLIINFPQQVFQKLKRIKILLNLK